jgi:hypothetical protein
MNLTERERELARRAIAKMQRENDPTLSEQDRELLKKYPRHTLAAARYIDSAPGPRWTPGQDPGYVSGFDKIVAQERGNFHLGGDHT